MAEMTDLELAIARAVRRGQALRTANGFKKWREPGFLIGDEVRTNRAALKWGATSKRLRGRVVGFSYKNRELIRVRLVGQGERDQPDLWHESFWELTQQAAGGGK